MQFFIKIIHFFWRKSLICLFFFGKKQFSLVGFMAVLNTCKVHISVAP